MTTDDERKALADKLDRWAKQRDLEQKIGEHGGPENAGRTHRSGLLREASAALREPAAEATCKHPLTHSGGGDGDE